MAPIASTAVGASGVSVPEMDGASPSVRYVRSGSARLAYRTVGRGPLDLAVITGPASHLDLQWEEPETLRTIRRLATFARVISFDRRGTGLSDPVDRAPTMDQQMDDLDAVLAAVG